MFSGLNLSVRPDFFSFLFEFLAFVFFFRQQFDKSISFNFFYISAIFSGLAIATKLNTLGVFMGILLYLIITKTFYRAFLYSLTTAITILSMFLLFYVYLGNKLFSIVLGSTKNEIISGLSFLNVLEKLAFNYTVFYLLTLIGIFIILKNNKSQGILFISCLTTSFVLATMGQLKVGAFFNYHFGFFMLAIIPVSIAINNILNENKSQPITKSIQIILISIVGLSLITSFTFYITFFNHFIYYPYKDVKNYLNENYPEGYIYTPDDSIILSFFDRTLIGPWSETFITITPSYQSYIPILKKELSKHDFSVTIKGGTGCENWQPSGIFIDEIKHLNHLDKQFQKICIFSAVNKE
jgi:hypothetical protein